MTCVIAGAGLDALLGQSRSQIEQWEFAEAAVQQLQWLDAIGQITSDVAHDFNNLFSVVLTNTRLLSRNQHDPSDHEGVELIRAAAERGVNLTAQLLAFSRKQRLEPQEVDLNSNIVGMSDLLSATSCWISSFMIFPSPSCMGGGSRPSLSFTKHSMPGRALIRSIQLSNSICSIFRGST